MKDREKTISAAEKEMMTTLEVCHEFYRRGWAVETNGRWSFTPQGFLLSNTLIGMLLEALSNQRRNTGTLRYAHAVDENQSTLFVQPAESDALFNGIS